MSSNASAYRERCACRQARKLQEMVKRMQQENENLRLGSGKAVVAAGRSMSPMGQTGHMVGHAFARYACFVGKETYMHHALREQCREVSAI